jgi:osmotically-inducible protein OsmY
MLSRYNTSPASQAKMRTEIANAEYSLARARCDAKTGADKDDCLTRAKAVHTASVADAKAGRPGASSGDADNANGASGAAGATAAGAGLAEKTKEAAHAVVEKTREVASGVAQKTEAAFDRNHENKADKPVDGKAADAGAKTRTAAQDMALTAKVKAGLIKEKDLESLGIHVETEKGVVMLSGFVNSKAEAEKAVAVAKGVDGVASVKSAIQVK